MITTPATATGLSVTARAPGKVNLSLSVGDRRDDGYHDLTTVFMAVAMFEDVTATVADELTVSVNTSESGIDVDDVPVNASNLAARAAIAVAEHAGVEPNVALHITKRIPVAGGMAGGSADAAAALVACNALWQVGLSDADLLALGAGLGADVPFCVMGGVALGTDRGDQLSPLLVDATEYQWVLANPGETLSTPKVFATLDKLRADGVAGPPSSADGVVKALRLGDVDVLGGVLTNDLQAAAVHELPGLQSLLDLGMGHGAVGAMVSGSGPTVAFLVPHNEAGLHLSVALAAAEVPTIMRTTGPAPGARVVEQP